MTSFIRPQRHTYSRVQVRRWANDSLKFAARPFRELQSPFSIVPRLGDNRSVWQCRPKAEPSTQGRIRLILLTFGLVIAGCQSQESDETKAWRLIREIRKVGRKSLEPYIAIAMMIEGVDPKTEVPKN